MKISIIHVIEHENLNYNVLIQKQTKYSAIKNVKQLANKKKAKKENV